MRDSSSLDAVYGMSIGQLLDMEEPDIRRLLNKAELVCNWLRGALQLKTKNGGV